MIKSFRHKGLMEVYENGASGKMSSALIKRVQRRLEILHKAERLEDLRVNGFNFHALRGKPQRYTIHVNGPWCITFEWEDSDAWRVDLEQYH